MLRCPDLFLFVVVFGGLRRSFMLGLGQLAEEVAVLESQLAAAELVHRERQVFWTSTWTWTWA